MKSLLQLITLLLLMALGSLVHAAGMIKGPNVVAPDRYVYYPGTEVLDKDEVRVIACGTGMPDARRGQASACFLFEFGNGEKMIFDIGTGSMRNVAALMIPYEYLTKVFLSHLHTDHWGDLDGLWAGGWTAGRPVPLEVWGPSGQTPDMGTAYAVEHFLKANNWDYQTRAFKVTPIPGNITVHEFDYKAENAVVYDQNGIVVRSIPAIHAGDGPVSFIIEYAGMKLIYGGDTTPNRWFVEYGKDADFVIHEAFANPIHYTTLMSQPPQLSWRMCCEFHTSGQAFGKIMSEIKPRYEFRAFAQDLGIVEENIRRLSPMTQYRESLEIYIMSAENDENNTKIRNELMDIKVLIQRVQRVEVASRENLDRTENRESRTKTRLKPIAKAPVQDDEDFWRGDFTKGRY